MSTRASRPTDFTADVDGVGKFTFGRRTMADEIAIQREYADILQGVEPTAWLQTMGGWLSTLRVLIVAAPPDWNIDELDPLDSQTYASLDKVYGALREQEDSFRAAKKPAGKGDGA